MDGSPGIDERLKIVWTHDEVRGTLLRDAPFRPFAAQLVRLLGLFGLSSVGAALLGQLSVLLGGLGWMTALAIAIGIARFVLGGLRAFVRRLAGARGGSWLQRLIGPRRWQFRITRTELWLSGGEAVWARMQPGARQTARFALDDRGAALLLKHVRGVQVGPEGLQICIPGELLLVDVAPEVDRGDLRALARFVLERAETHQHAVAEQARESWEAKRALGRLASSRPAARIERHPPPSRRGRTLGSSR